uniref:Uncharacterized protein n=1 Tax=Anguilla anguilla TaxID=7936 RepID=A0A0E9WUG6_ANGAN
MEECCLIYFYLFRCFCHFVVPRTNHTVLSLYIHIIIIISESPLVSQSSTAKG